MTKNNNYVERTYLEAVLNIRTGPYFMCSLTLAAIDGPYFRMVLIFGWSLFSVIYGRSNKCPENGHPLNCESL